MLYLYKPLLHYLEIHTWLAILPNVNGWTTPW